jgi:S-DNA-T family DNA segregation ATPase FtsK/SpoIIIE
VLDDAPAALLEGLARRLAPLRLSADSYDGHRHPAGNLAELLGVTDPTGFDRRRLWRPRPERDFLRVPIGLDRAGRPLLLDIKESAQLGMGPARAVRRGDRLGKSELLRTFVLALGRQCTRPTTWPWCSSTTRAGPPSRRSRRCRTSPG